MPKNIFVDLNVILDVLLERPRFETSRKVLKLPESTAVTLFISAHAVTTFAYILERDKVPVSKVKQQVNWLLGTFIVVPTTLSQLQAALGSEVSDYEDAVVEQAALACRASVIITRNIKDFRNSAVQAATPEVYLKT